MGLLIAEYFTIVRPVEVFFARQFQCNGAEDLAEFMWADYKKGLWKGEYLSDLLKIETSRYELPGFGVQEYRQIATAFMEKHVKYKIKKTAGVNAILDWQAGHNSEMAAEYATASGDHFLVTREDMHQYFLGSKEWYEVLWSLNVQKGMSL